MAVCDTVALEVVSGNIIVYDQGGAEMFCHNLRYLQKLAGGNLNISLGFCNILSFSVISSNKAGVFYVLKDSKRSQVCHCLYYVYYNIFLQGKSRVRSYKCFLFILQSVLQVIFHICAVSKTQRTVSCKCLPRVTSLDLPCISPAQ